MQEKQNYFVLVQKAAGYDELLNTCFKDFFETVHCYNARIMAYSKVKYKQSGVEINKKNAPCFKMFLQLLGVNYTAHECYNNIYFEFYNLTETCADFINQYLNNIPEA